MIYTPTAFGLVDENLIDEFINLSEDIAGDLMKILPQRSIVQYVIYGEPVNSEAGVKERNSHAAVLTIEGGNLYLLDASRNEPVNLSEDDTEMGEWIGEMQYLAIFEVEPQNYTPKFITSIADAFERIYSG